MKENIKPATGRLGVLVVGVGGAVATTMITGNCKPSSRCLLHSTTILQNV